MKRLALAILVLLASSLPAAAWHCRNNDFEITCDPTGCTASDDFTPMDVYFTEEGDMAVCAYSGCWEGRANQIVRSNDYLMLAASSLAWQGSQARGEAIAVLLDKRTRIAVLNGAGYAHPLHCVP